MPWSRPKPDLGIVVAPMKPARSLKGISVAASASRADKRYDFIIGPVRGHTHNVALVGMRVGAVDFAITAQKVAEDHREMRMGSVAEPSPSPEPNGPNSPKPS